MRPGRSCLPELRSPAAFADRPPSVCTSGETGAADTLPGGPFRGGPRDWARGPPRNPAMSLRPHQGRPCAPSRRSYAVIMQLRRSGTESSLTLRWREMDSNYWSRDGETPLGRAMWFPRMAPPALRSTDPERDEKFESGFLQRRVCCELRAKARGRNLGRPSSSPRTSGPRGFVAATGANRSAISPAAITSTRARFQNVQGLAASAEECGARVAEELPSADHRSVHRARHPDTSSAGTGRGDDVLRGGAARCQPIPVTATSDHPCLRREGLVLASSRPE